MSSDLARNGSMKIVDEGPVVTIDKIFPMDCVVNTDGRQKHVDYAMSLNLPRCITRKERKGKVAIVASGPSATEFVDLLKAWVGEIWGINGAFAWLIHRGIKPTGFVGLDPEALLKEYLITMPDDATYYLGACCHPEVFDHLKGKNVRVWFPIDGQVKFPFGAVPVHGGSTCLGRAPNLAYLLGYRDVHIFGGDSSFTDKEHVYDEAGMPAGSFPVKLGGSVYHTTRQMLSQACEFAEQMLEWSIPGLDGGAPLSVSLYGDGLTQALYAHQLEAGTYHQYLRELQPEMSRKLRRAMR